MIVWLQHSLCLLASLFVLTLAAEPPQQTESPTVAVAQTNGPAEITPASVSARRFDIDNSSDCSVLANFIGPFCLYVERGNDNNFVVFSQETNNTCGEVLSECGGSLVNGSTSIENQICSSRLVSSCGDLELSEEDVFLMEFCSLVQVMCPEEFTSMPSSSSTSGSGSGSASAASGLSGSGPYVTNMSGSGEQSGGGSSSGSGSSNSMDDLEQPDGDSKSGSEQPNSSGEPDTGNNSGQPDVDGRSGRPDVDGGSGRPDVDGGSGRPDTDDGSGRPDTDGGSGRPNVTVDHGSGRPGEGIGSGRPDVDGGSGQSGENGASGRPGDEYGGSGQSNNTVDGGSGRPNVTVDGDSEQPGVDGSGQQPDSDTDFTTTSALPSTTMTPLVLVNVEDLTAMQRENIVNILFKGVTEEQFVKTGITIFRKGIISLVNLYLSNSNGKSRQRRQQAALSPDDVIIVELLVVVDGGLQVAFVISGQSRGQMSPVSGSDVAKLLKIRGQQLAMELSTGMGTPVQIIEVTPRYEQQTATTQPITSMNTASTNTQFTVSDQVNQEMQQVSAGAIVGVVLGVLLVISLLSVLIVIITAVLGYWVLQRQRKKSHRVQVTVSNRYCDGKPVDDGEDKFSSTLQPMSENNDYVSVPTSRPATDDFTSV